MARGAASRRLARPRGPCGTCVRSVLTTFLDERRETAFRFRLVQGFGRDSSTSVERQPSVRQFFDERRETAFRSSRPRIWPRLLDERRKSTPRGAPRAKAHDVAQEHVQQVAAGVICGVAFLREIDDSFNLDQALLRIFNRRGAVRVEPDPQVPVTIHIHSPDGRPLCSGLLRDLSLTGLGIAVAPVDMALLPRDSSVALRFALAGEVFDMPALVRFGRVSSEQRPGGVTPEPVGIVGLELDDQARNPKHEIYNACFSAISTQSCGETNPKQIFS